MAISAKVAEVISSYEVAFSAGADAGVQKDDHAWIFRETPVTDPDSGDVLGIVRRPTLEFRIVEVQPKLSVGTTVGNVQKQPSAPLAILQEAPQRIRVTASPGQRDYRTRLVAIGDHVEIAEPKEGTAPVSG